MSISLAVKYRPQTWDEVCDQASIVKILTRQIAEESIKNCYLFCGISGSGKTTSARLLANDINKHIGTPIEIDAASNNGVDNIKSIVKAAQERSIEGKYKVYIIDECHSLTPQAWQAFLKCIEEPPKYTIFIFCTTDPQKVPETILNRCQRFNFNRISTNKIYDRLAYICRQEGFTNYESSIDYIAKIADGGMRTAISYLDKCASYSTDLSIDNVLAALGNYSYETLFRLLRGVIKCEEAEVLRIISEFYDQGNDLKLFVEQVFAFVLDIEKYVLFKSCDLIKIPSTMENEIIGITSFEKADKYYSYLLDRLLELKNMLKNDSNPLTTIEVSFLRMARAK